MEEPSTSNVDEHEDSSSHPNSISHVRLVSDTTVLSDLYKHHLTKLVGYLRKQFGDGPPDPEDVAQLAFQKLIERKDSHKIKNLQAFLWRTARNLTLNGHRYNQVRKDRDFEVEQLYFAEKSNDSTPERVLEVKQQLTIVSRVLQQMPDRRREAFVLNRVEGLNPAQIAGKFGITRAAVVKHIARAAAEIDLALELAATGFQNGE
ncbi:MAG: sigma-70 family RNA polymerase sigma factor [Pseudomonadota bacterium]